MKMINGISVFEFTNLHSAESFALKSTKAAQILFGDFPYYWVTNLANAEKLIRAGYEPVQLKSETLIEYFFMSETQSSKTPL